MAVQIPTLQRVGPVAPESAGRLQVEPLNVTRGVAQTAGALGQLGESMTKGLVEAEDRASEIKAQDLSTRFEVEYTKGLDQLRGLKGDPTKAYAEFDSKMEEMKSTIADQYKDASGPSQAIIKSKLAGTQSRLQMKRLIEQSSQYRTYTRNVADAAVNLETDSAILNDLQEDVIGNQDITEAKDFKFDKLNQGLERIVGIRDKEGNDEGLMSDDGKGNQVRSAILVDRIRQDTSKALGNVIQSLHAAGKADMAAEVLERYGDQINAKTRLDLLKKNKTEAVDQEALKIDDDLKFMDPSAALKKIDSMTTNLEVRKRAREFVDDRARRNDLNEKRTQEDAYNNMFGYVDEKIGKLVKSTDEKGNETEQVYTKTMFESDQFWKAQKDRMSPQQRRAILDRFDNRKESEESAVNRMLSRKASDYAGMSPSALQVEMTGLSDQHKNLVIATYRKVNSPTASEDRATLKYLEDSLATQMDLANLVAGPNQNKWKRASRANFEEYRVPMMEHFNNMPPGTKPAEIDSWVKKFVVAKKNKQVFEPPDSWSRRPNLGPTKEFNKIDTVVNEASKPGPVRDAWNKKFTAKHKRAFKPGSDDLAQFIKDNDGKL